MKKNAHHLSQIERLVLGTAQLGMAYGIANTTCQPDQTLATEIVREAWNNGIRVFDTAQGYGNSEEILGKAIFDLGIGREALVISKFDPSLDHLDEKILERALNKSLNRLSIPQLFGMMLHSEELLKLWDQGLEKILRSVVQEGKVKLIGVSIYSPEKAIQAINTPGIDLVQLPTNILDRRFEQAGVFQLADKKKKKIYVRSVFLQGLILMKPEEIPEKMSFARPVLERLESLSKETGLARPVIALGALKMAIPNDVQVIFGADTPVQVKENVRCWEKKHLPSLLSLVKKTFRDVDEKILNPTLWPNSVT